MADLGRNDFGEKTKDVSTFVIPMPETNKKAGKETGLSAAFSTHNASSSSIHLLYAITVVVLQMFYLIVIMENKDIHLNYY